MVKEERIYRCEICDLVITSEFKDFGKAKKQTEEHENIPISPERLIRYGLYKFKSPQEKSLYYGYTEPFLGVISFSTEGLGSRTGIGFAESKHTRFYVGVIYDEEKNVANIIYGLPAICAIELSEEEFKAKRKLLKRFKVELRRERINLEDVVRGEIIIEEKVKGMK